MAGVGLLCQSNLPFLRSGEPSWGDEAALSSKDFVEVDDEDGAAADADADVEALRLDGVDDEVANEVAREKTLLDDPEEDEAGEERKSVPKMSI